MLKYIVLKDDKEKRGWEAADYFNLGWSLVTPILLGVIIGLYLDRLFNTKPFFILGFIFLGFIASIYNIFKITNK